MIYLMFTMLFPLQMSGMQRICLYDREYDTVLSMLLVATMKMQLFLFAYCDLFMRKVIMKPFCARLAPEVYVLANFQNVQLLCGQEAPLMFVNCFRFSKMLPEIFCIC